MYSMDDYAPPSLSYTSFSQCQKRQQGVNMCVIVAIAVILIALYVKQTPMKPYQPPAIVSQCAAGMSSIVTSFKDKFANSSRMTPGNMPSQLSSPTRYDDNDEDDEEEGSSHF